MLPAKPTDLATPPSRVAAHQRSCSTASQATGAYSGEPAVHILVSYAADIWTVSGFYCTHAGNVDFVVCRNDGSWRSWTLFCPDLACAYWCRSRPLSPLSPVVVAGMQAACALVGLSSDDIDGLETWAVPAGPAAPRSRHR